MNERALGTEHCFRTPSRAWAELTRSEYSCRCHRPLLDGRAAIRGEAFLADGTERHPGPPDPIEAIKFRMEQQGLTRKAAGHAHAGLGGAQPQAPPVHRHDPPAARRTRHLGRGPDPATAQ